MLCRNCGRSALDHSAYNECPITAGGYFSPAGSDYARESAPIYMLNKGESSIRKFDTGATRDQDTTKLDFEGFLSPIVLERFAAYMHKNRIQSDGSVRASDNWQKGIPKAEYMKSMWRHFFAVWKKHRAGEDATEDLCALMFNVMGYLFESLNGR